MKKFLVLYHAPKDAIAQNANMTPEQAGTGYANVDGPGKKNVGDKLVELGILFMNGQKISHDGSVANSDKDVAGYSILQAENMDEAKSLLQGTPT